MTPGFHLFERFGVELEYMIVSHDTLDVLPVTDEVLRAIAGAYESDVDRNGLSWSNELVLHVIELKTNGPRPSLDGLAQEFQHDVGAINNLLAPLDGMLLPTAAHPWMDPATQTRLWPHEYNPVYETFNRIFDCRGHGWSNLQSTHVNLPFADDEEFGRLHAAIRLVLPVLPALTASSPILDRRPRRQLDARLEVYRHNADRVPSVAGRIIPEPVYSREAYEQEILGRIYRDLAPYDPEGILRHEWANARGAIARFDRNTIEIRVLDIQECPAADLAILRLIVATLQALVAERWADLATQQEWPVARLEPIFLDTIREAERAVIRDAGFLRMFGLNAATQCTTGELWRHLAESLFTAEQRAAADLAPLGVILGRGCLARRILRATGEDCPPAALVEVYRQLARCLSEGCMFAG